MPYTDEFRRIRRRFLNQYSDKAKAESFAFEEAFKNKVRTFTDRRAHFKKIGKGVYFPYDL